MADDASILLFTLAMAATATLCILPFGIGAAWALAVFVFKLKFILPVLPLLGAMLIVPALTVLTGFLMSRGVLSQPPLEILRAEV